MTAASQRRSLEQRSERRDWTVAPPSSRHRPAGPADAASRTSPAGPLHRRPNATRTGKRVDHVDSDQARIALPPVLPSDRPISLCDVCSAALPSRTPRVPTPPSTTVSVRESRARTEGITRCCLRDDSWVGGTTLAGPRRRPGTPKRPLADGAAREPPRTRLGPGRETLSPTRAAGNGFRRSLDRPCSSQALAGIPPALPAEADFSRAFTGLAIRVERWSGFPPTLPFVFPKPPYGCSGTWPSTGPPRRSGTGAVRFSFGPVSSPPCYRCFGCGPYPTPSRRPPKWTVDPERGVQCIPASSQGPTGREGNNINVS